MRYTVRPQPTPTVRQDLSSLGRKLAAAVAMASILSSSVAVSFRGAMATSFSFSSRMRSSRSSLRLIRPGMRTVISTMPRLRA